MPIYEYECKKCKYKFEQLQKITEKPLRTCPECKKTSLSKLVSNTSFQLKGSGWYVTDFKDKKGESSETKANEGQTSQPAKKKESASVPVKKSENAEKK